MIARCSIANAKEVERSRGSLGETRETRERVAAVIIHSLSYLKEEIERGDVSLFAQFLRVIKTSLGAAVHDLSSLPLSHPLPSERVAL